MGQKNTIPYWERIKQAKGHLDILDQNFRIEIAQKILFFCSENTKNDDPLTDEAFRSAMKDAWFHFNFHQKTSHKYHDWKIFTNEIHPLVIHYLIDSKLPPKGKKEFKQNYEYEYNVKFKIESILMQKERFTLFYVHELALDATISEIWKKHGKEFKKRKIWKTKNKFISFIKKKIY